MKVVGFLWKSVVSAEYKVPPRAHIMQATCSRLQQRQVHVPRACLTCRATYCHLSFSLRFIQLKKIPAFPPTSISHLDKALLGLECGDIHHERSRDPGFVLLRIFLASPTNLRLLEPIYLTPNNHALDGLSSPRHPRKNDRKLM